MNPSARWIRSTAKPSDEFLDMQRQLKKTVMLVSHDIDEALKLGDRIAVFRRGKIVQNASADELLARPANEFVASLCRQGTAR